MRRRPRVCVPAGVKPGAGGAASAPGASGAGALGSGITTASSRDGRGRGPGGGRARTSASGVALNGGATTTAGVDAEGARGAAPVLARVRGIGQRPDRGREQRRARRDPERRAEPAERVARARGWRARSTSTGIVLRLLR